MERDIIDSKLRGYTLDDLNDAFIRLEDKLKKHLVIHEGSITSKLEQFKSEPKSLNHQLAYLELKVAELSAHHDHHDISIKLILKSLLGICVCFLVVSIIIWIRIGGSIL